eukprot:902843-Pleurochrysis_carterae.AAC.1
MLAAALRHSSRSPALEHPSDTSGPKPSVSSPDGRMYSAGAGGIGSCAGGEFVRLQVACAGRAEPKGRGNEGAKLAFVYAVGTPVNI